MRHEQTPIPDPDQGPPLGPPVGVERFAEAARLCAEGREDLARRGHAPDGVRRLRAFPLAEAARLAGLAPAALRKALRDDPTLPQGEPETPGAPPRFAFDDLMRLRARLAAKQGGKPGAAPLPARPEGAAPRILAIANFKGGVGKTSLAAHIAMAAALDGLKVLAVDLDSQGSLTSLFGARIEDAWETAYPLIARDYAHARTAAGLPLDDEALERAAAMSPADVIRPTHWPAIDLIGAQLDLYWAEFQIPVWRLALRSWKLWDGLAEALEEAARDGGYDLVILDTPPALGYLTINALAAADLLLVPLGASFLEFESTGRFFDMLHATFASIEEGEASGTRFEWDAVRCVLTRYDAAQQAEMAALMAHWFGDILAGRRLDLTALAGQAGEQTRALLDADPRDFNRETYARGRDAFDRVWEEMRGLLLTAWARDVDEGTGPVRRETEETR